MSRLKPVIREHPCSSFFVLAFLWTYTYDAIIYVTVGPSPGLLLGELPRTWGPLIAAVLVTWLLDGNLREWAGQVTKWRVKPRWYVLAIGLPFLFANGLAESGIHLIAGGSIEVLPSPWWHYVLNFVVVLFFAGALEEFGWRGFAQPRLQERYSAFVAALGIGGIWVIWHLPLFYLFDFTAYDTAALWGTFGVWLIARSVVFAWIYNSTGGSLLFPMLMHALGNLPQVMVPATELNGIGQYAGEILLVLFSIGLVVVYGQSYLAASPPDPLVPGNPARDG